ncbi:hypothetical protein DWU98_09455 [Dyella monticola]|uniref:Uncharacterized protein n=1 Tax=Dyella monticola TaxID=1927958 RepID=A0A370X1U5_9GAMM|nr:hypothetical protein [Dyella monticola]RDS82250.1 hypothetical protein DWU98_09455 [Dyella monticola]
MSDSFANASDRTLGDLILKLQGLEPDEDTLLRDKYSRVHVHVATAIARGNTPRQILELLKQSGLELHHATFTKLFKAEQAVRDEHGERICCVTCGQPLKHKEQDRSDKRGQPSDVIDTAEELEA